MYSRRKESYNLIGRLMNIIGTHSRSKKGQATTCYNAIMLPEIQIDDIVRLRKPHPCGGFEWRVFRLGADNGLECMSCERRVLLPRRTLARRLKTILPSVEKNDLVS
jgi:hypothetical protein